MQAVHRAARQAQPTYAALCATVRGSPVVTADETSWRVAADLQWLWAFVTPGDDRLCHSARPRPRAGRGASSAATTPASCSATAGSRIGNSTRRCIRRVSRICCAAAGSCCSTIRSSRLSSAVKASCRPPSPRGSAITGHHLHPRPRDRAGAATSSASAASWGGDRVDASDGATVSDSISVVEFDAIFSFLFDPTLDATNWRAEQALRPAVVTRKICGGGNRTARGAQTQQVLASGLRTAHQRGLDTTELSSSRCFAPWRPPSRPSCSELLRLR